MSGKLIYIQLLIITVLIAGCATRQPMEQLEAERTGGPMPPPNTEGMTEFSKSISFASRYIEEGDYESAIENLLKAQEIRDTASVHELLGIAYDAERDPDTAFTHFLRAGKMYYEQGNTKKAWSTLGWLRTIRSKDPEVIEFEKMLRAQ
ncbi:hypothetical protein ACFLZI_00405 [Nitrospirota bacterium]